jgi:hypothetical protein
VRPLLAAAVAIHAVVPAQAPLNEVGALLREAAVKAGCLESGGSLRTTDQQAGLLIRSVDGAFEVVVECELQEVKP